MIFVSRKPPEHRLRQQPYQRMATVPAGACVCRHRDPASRLRLRGSNARPAGSRISPAEGLHSGASRATIVPISTMSAWPRWIRGMRAWAPISGRAYRVEGGAWLGGGNSPAVDPERVTAGLQLPCCRRCTERGRISLHYSNVCQQVVDQGRCRAFFGSKRLVPHVKFFGPIDVESGVRPGPPTFFGDRGRFANQSDMRQSSPWPSAEVCGEILHSGPLSFGTQRSRDEADEKKPHRSVAADRCSANHGPLTCNVGTVSSGL
jgi:hypothetical protein